MINIPSKIVTRLVTGIKKFQPVLDSARSRDVNESDTVIIITDILSEIFGFNKYSDITSEFSVKGTYCDLATKIDGKVNYLLEAKAVGIELKDAFVKQAVDYAANAGIDWVVLTNGIFWRVYKVYFSKPIEHEVIFELNLLNLNTKNQEQLELLYYLTLEGAQKSHLDAYHSQKQALNKFFMSALILGDPVIDTIKRELRKISPDVKVDTEQLRSVIGTEVLKREVVEGEKADEARKKILKFQQKQQRIKAKTLAKNANNGESLPNNNVVADTNPVAE